MLWVYDQYNFLNYSRVGIVFRRQILASENVPSAERVKITKRNNRSKRRITAFSFRRAVPLSMELSSFKTCRRAYICVPSWSRVEHNTYMINLFDGIYGPALVRGHNVHYGHGTLVTPELQPMLF